LIERVAIILTAQQKVFNVFGLQTAAVSANSNLLKAKFYFSYV